MEKFIQIFTTTSSKKSAMTIADALVSKRLAACVQVIGPISSVYNWDGKKEHSKEWLCIIKSRKSLYSRVEKAIKELHDYSLPEITSFEMGGSKDYLSWVGKETR